MNKRRVRQISLSLILVVIFLSGFVLAIDSNIINAKINKEYIIRGIRVQNVEKIPKNATVYNLSNPDFKDNDPIRIGMSKKIAGGNTTNRHKTDNGVFIDVDKSYSNDLKNIFDKYHTYSQSTKDSNGRRWLYIRTSNRTRRISLIGIYRA